MFWVLELHEGEPLSFAITLLDRHVDLLDSQQAADNKNRFKAETCVVVFRDKKVIY
jgi:hypothetical protein